MPDEPQHSLFGSQKLFLVVALVSATMIPTLIGVLTGVIGDSWQSQILWALPMVLAIILAFVALGLPDEVWRRAAEVALARAPHFLFHLFFTLVFLADLAFWVLFLLFPETVVAANEEIILDVQLLGCIATAGLLGGFIRQVHTTLRPFELTESTDQPSAYVRFWSTLFSLFSSVFIATVLFALLRAGILKTVEVDTFNVYGVTGVAAVSGYFADSIISRFTHLYKELLGAPEDAG